MIIFSVNSHPAFFWVVGIRNIRISAILYHPNQKVYYRARGNSSMMDTFYSTESYITETTLPRGVPFSQDRSTAAISLSDFC
jgi:hypothetical protein